MSDLQRSLCLFSCCLYTKHSVRVTGRGAHVSDVSGGVPPLCERKPAGEIALSRV